MIELKISEFVRDKFNETYKQDLSLSDFNLTKTKSEHVGDFTLVVFPLLKHVKTSPEKLAEAIGTEIVDNINEVDSFNVIKGFLNISLKQSFWITYLKDFDLSKLQIKNKENNSKKIVIEFSSPNTNKPLHLGHIRNNLLGVAVSNILKYVDYDVTRVSLLNDRGIHICKSMLAWEEWGNRITPEQAGKKGDHLIGDFYVSFDQHYKQELQELMKSGLTKEQAAEQSILMQRTLKLLKKWERGNKKVLETWKTLNTWVEEGFNETYKKLGVEFDKIYYESDTYLKGKDVVLREILKGNVKSNDDGSASIDLTDVGLDEKILLRSNGTSVYITQDIGTALERYNEFKFDRQIYVVGNEQIYHFKVLKEVLKKFDYKWYDKIEHYSYGMVELPDGKMKSREGTVVDADDLIDEMFNTAKAKALELGKLDHQSPDEFKHTMEVVSMGALKYFMLKVDPKKNMMFNPNESIDFNGNTGPFIQYSYTRIYSLLEKALEEKISTDFDDNSFKNIDLSGKEISLIKEVYNFKGMVIDAAKNLNPAAIANYVYNLAKLYNSFYQEFTIFKCKSDDLKSFRLKLSESVAVTIKTGLNILGIDVPHRM